MSPQERREDEARLRREPPPFRRVAVRRVEPLTSRMVRIVLGGPDLDGLRIGLPAASVRLLIPSPETTELVVPVWNGNEFLLPTGERPTIRTFTPRDLDPQSLELRLDVVLHDGGAVSAWALSAQPGAPAAVSGPGRGYEIATDAPFFLLAGDETAIPAISQLLEVIPADMPVRVMIEVTHPDARLPLPAHPRVEVEWLDLPPGAQSGDALVAAVAAADIGPASRVWAAGEAAAMHQIRRHLFDDVGLARSLATVRGYWKRERPRP